MVHVHRSVNSPNRGKQNVPGSWAKEQKIAQWSFAEYQIKLLKFACKFPAVFAWGSCRGQAPPVLSQGRSVSFHQPRGAAQLKRDGTCLLTTLYSLEVGQERGMGKCHLQYGDGCHVWALNFIKASPGASHNGLLWGSHIHYAHHTSRHSGSLGHMKRKWQSGIWTQRWIYPPSSFHYAYIKGALSLQTTGNMGDEVSTI